MTKDKKLLVAAIKNGTVIDHIKAGHALKIIRLLDLAKHKNLITVGLNLPSKATRIKDLIKVEGRELTIEEINRIAIFAPQGTMNIIKNYEVVKKIHAKIPDVVEYVIVCPNLKCITNHENMNSKFHVLENKGEVTLKCHYCEKSYLESKIKDYKNN